MDPEYGRRYRELYTRHWWWRAREEAILDVLRRYQKPGAGNGILDVGCGDGLFFQPLAEFGEVEGIEPDGDLVRPENPDRARIRVAPFDQSFRPGKQYSLILILDVLEHLPDPAAALRHAASLLLPGGALLATVPAFKLLWTNHDVINHHRTRYRRRTFRPLAESAGLQIVEECYWYQWTCPVKLAQRLAENALRLRPAPPSIPPGWINQPLFWLSRLEQQTLGRVGFPFGSTLMTYCRK